MRTSSPCLPPAILAALLLLLSLTACGGDKPSPEAANNAVNNDVNNDFPNNNGNNDVNNDPNNAVNNDAPGPRRAEVAHSFGAFPLEPFQEVNNCVQWTLHNEETLYIESVTLSNGGFFHHSNWFVVPESVFEGEDGFFRCRDRGFAEVTAALRGTVLFAQSTQSQVEAQRLGPGIVIKVPPRHKVIAGVHMLNLSPRDIETELRMALEIIHPADVQVVVSPFRLSYLDLDIPARRESRFTGTCDLSTPFSQVTGEPFGMNLYWVLPHYHELGNHFRLEIIGGERDGEVLYELSGFNADANGKAFDPPVNLAGTTGLRFTCGFDNPRNEAVGWGIGDQEMCVMLGFTDSRILFDSSVTDDSEIVGDDGQIVQHAGPCAVVPLMRNAAQGMPDEDEVAGELYIPPPSGQDDGLPPVIECEDLAVDAVAEAPVSFQSVNATIFQSGCGFSACHDATSPAAGLDLSDGEGLYDRLMGHAVSGDTDKPLIAPGDPEGSWLFEVLARCEPATRDGGVAPRMPMGAPTLLDPPVVAKLRDWIAAGAPND